jgi:hypothetical protein
MKKRTLCLLTLIFLFNWLHGQPQLLMKGKAEFSADINVLEESFQSIKSDSDNTLIQQMDVELQDFEFVITYQLAPLKDEQYYQVAIEFTQNGKKLDVLPAFISGDVGRINNTTRSDKQEITWTDLLEQYLNLDGEISFSLTAELWGKPLLPFGIECDNPPVFSLKQKWPHYASGLTGVAAFGSGLVLFNRAENIYENEYLTAITETEAEPFYQDANRKRRTGLSLMYTGAGVVLVDLIWYSVRQIRYNQRKKAFDRFCNQRVSLSPVYLAPLDQSGNAQAGLRLTCRF